jgi:hypothetical protein
MLNQKMKIKTKDVGKTSKLLIKDNISARFLDNDSKGHSITLQRAD